MANWSIELFGVVIDDINYVLNYIKHHVLICTFGVLVFAVAFGFVKGLKMFEDWMDKKVLEKKKI